MTNCFKILFFYLIISLVPIWHSYSQSASTQNTFLSQNFILSLESGINYGFSDYQKSKIEPGIRGSIEYFPVIFTKTRIGLRLFGGGTRLSFSDSREQIPSNDLPNPRTIPADIYTDIIQVGSSLSFGFSLGESLIPYLSVGAAYLQFSPKYFDWEGEYDKNIFSVLIEGGVKIKLSDRFGLNAAVSYYPTPTDYLENISSSNRNDTFLSGLIGISYAFVGRFDNDQDGIDNDADLCPETPIGVKVDEFGCPIDSDFDGVPDYLDKCSNTPIGGVPVDSIGCPIDADNDGVPDYLDKCPNTPTNIGVDSIGCPIDADNDGVPDYLDKCLNTPYGVEVDSIGCSVDSDKDGIPDYLDSCPDTPINTKVDSTGCPETTMQQEETFYQFILRGDDTFEPNSATMIDLAKILLNEIASYIKNQPKSKWRIEGHTDNQGSASLLKKLSYERAETIYDYLISQGLSSEQFTIYGIGSASPAVNNSTPEGRSTNRRILIIRED